MAAPHSSRYPRPLRATHTFSQAAAASQQAKRPSTTAAASPSSPGAPASKKVTLPLSPDPQRASVERRTVLVPIDSGDTVPDSEVASRRRANSLTSLADPGCCYGNSLGPQTNQVSTDSAEPQLHRFSHKRSSSCSSADSLKKTAPVVGPVRRPDAAAVHTRKSIEGLNQEISSALEGMRIILPHHPPDGHMAPIRDLLGSASHTSPHFTLHSSPSSLPPSLPSSPYPLSTSVPATPTELPDTPTGFVLPPSSSLPNPSFDGDPPVGIERCRTSELKPHTEDLVSVGPDRSKAKIVFQGSSAFLPTHRAVAINSVS